VNINLIKKIDYHIGFALILALWPINFFINKLIKVCPISFFKKKITFIKIVGGGSLLIAAPSIYAIKKQHPKYKICLLCSKSVAPFARPLNIFDEINIISLQNPIVFLISLLKGFFKIVFSNFIINLETHSKLASLLALYTLSKDRVGIYLNYNKWQSNLINNPIFMNIYHPIYDGYTNIAYALKCQNVSFEKMQTHFKISNRLSNSTPKNNYVVIAPFCSDIYIERELNSFQIKKIISKLKHPKNTKYLLLGGNSDLDKSKKIELELKSYNLKNRVGNTSIQEVIDVLSHAKLLITIDSGLLHLARLIGIKTLSYWGPSDPSLRLFGNLSRDTTIYNRISCSPCVHILDKAPCSGENLCIKQYFEPISKKIFWKIQ